MSSSTQYADLQDAAGGPKPPISAATPARRRWVLFVLLGVATFNMLDRGAIGVVQEPMRRALGLSDFQLGLLGGPAFALLYTLISVPLARLADRRARVPLIAACLAVWSAMTALCGVASNYLMLLACRLGVSVGEAGSGPASQSVVVDYFPPERRATALAVLALGTPLASLISGLGGGWVTEHLGWRATFLALGLPGLVLALVLLLTVREPVRQTPVTTIRTDRMADVFAILLRRPTLLFMTGAVSLACFAGYSVHQYFISFMMRSHGLDLMSGAIFGAIVYGVCAALGTIVGGALADRGRRRFPRILAWLPVVGLLIAGPCYMAGFLTPSLGLMAVLVPLAAFTNYLYVGTMSATIYELVPSAIQSTTVALFGLTITLLGYGLGPPFLGFLSDVLAHDQLSANDLTAGACKGAQGATAAICENARELGLRRAIVIVLSCYFWAGLLYLGAVFTLQPDRARAAALLATP